MESGTVYDLLIRGGRVIDPKNGIDRVVDVAISGRSVARVAPDLDPADAARVVDADPYETSFRVRRGNGFDGKRDGLRVALAISWRASATSKHLASVFSTEARNVIG